MITSTNHQPKPLKGIENNPFTGSSIPKREITAINFTGNNFTGYGSCGSTDVIPYKEHTTKPINKRPVEVK